MNSLQLQLKGKWRFTKRRLVKLRATLKDKRGFSDETCDSFFGMFGLVHRKRWSEPPKGFTKKDMYPWRFSRRLSLMARPLLIFGLEDSSTVVFANSDGQACAGALGSYD